jgi:NAD(P)-dependent dehydrogenase (short-subunit alcohol dehydrogenase family)
MDLGLDAKRALITGAGQGVGEGIARVLAEAGAHVVVNDLVEDRAAAVADAITGAGGQASPAAFDVTDHDGVRAAIDACGPIDILVNNAGNAGADGWPGTVPFTDTSPADWDVLLQVNLLGVMHCVHAVLPAMVEARWGRIITVVSDAGRTGDAQLAVYGAAKAGAAGFSRGIAREVGRHGITVNSVALGTMRTPLTEAFWDDPDHAERQQAMLRDYVVRRPGEVDDAAWTVAWLAAARSGWITGQTVPVNGGRSFAL